MKDSARTPRPACKPRATPCRSRVVRRLRRGLSLLALAALPGALAAQTGAPFVAGCSYPFADIAVQHSIDSDCGILGNSKADAANQAQNKAKNNFCATGDPIAVTPADLVNLQAAVLTAKIPFGDTHNLPADRSVLVNLAKTAGGTPIGEGSKVVLVALVEKAHYSDVPSAAEKAKGKGGESVNCNEFLDDTNDIHIPLVQTSDADECTSVTAEMSPHGRPAGWTPAALNQPGQVVRVTGNLFFDGSHRPCTAGHPQSPKRASLWEIHPVYAIDICTGTTIADCPVGDDSKWHALQAKPPSAPSGQ
jgi:hypothetical protein